MTKFRQPLTIQAAVHRAIAILGLENAANIIGKQPSTLYAYGDLDKERHISMEDALALDMACLRENGEAPFMTAHRGALRDVGFDGHVDLMPALLDMHHDASGLSELVSKSRSDNSQDGALFSAAERFRINDAGNKVLAEVTRILDFVNKTAA